MLLKIVELNEKHVKDKNYQALFTTVLGANLALLLEVRKMITMTPELMEKLEEAVMDTGLSEKLIAQGKIEGKKEGKKEGSLETQLGIAISLLDVLSDKLIAEKTGLSMEKIKKLRQQYDKN